MISRPTKLLGEDGGDHFRLNEKYYQNDKASSSVIPLPPGGRVAIRNYGSSSIVQMGIADTLTRGASDDDLRGADVSDTLNGGAGFHALESGHGNEVLAGGGQADLFV